MHRLCDIDIFLLSSAHPVGSSIMLLGGFGFLSRLHGLSIDNLVEVEMVLADGRIVVVSENEYPGKSSALVLDCVMIPSQTYGGQFAVQALVWGLRPVTKQKPILSL